MLSSQGITNNDNEEALAGAAATLSLLSLPTDNSNSQNLSQHLVKMKCYYDHKHFPFLDYFNDTIPDDAVFYASDIPFQYNKMEGMYTEFIGGNLIGTCFVAAKRDQEFLVSQGRNKLNMSNNSISFASHNTNERCSN